MLKLFIVGNIVYEDNMLGYTPLDSLKEVYPDTTQVALNLMVVSNFYRVMIDDKLIEIDRWYNYYKKSTDQRGYIAYIPIDNLSQGMHHIKVTGPTDNYSIISEIPFYKEISYNQRMVPKQSDSKEEQSSDFQPKPFGIRD